MTTIEAVTQHGFNNLLSGSAMQPRVTQNGAVDVPPDLLEHILLAG